jgi:hypothetical protein
MISELFKYNLLNRLRSIIFIQYNLISIINLTKNVIIREYNIEIIIFNNY